MALFSVSPRAFSVCDKLNLKKSPGLYLKKVFSIYKKGVRLKEMKVKITEIDFTEQILEKAAAEEKAGYPPKCNPGYKVSPDKKKCIPTEEGDAGWKKKKTK